MTGMVIGRLWLTSDLEVRKGHGLLNRLWADVLSDHGKVTETNEDTRKFDNVNISVQIFILPSEVEMLAVR